MKDLLFCTVEELRSGLRSRAFSSEELTRACLDRAEETASFGAVLTLCREGAMEAARAADRRLGRGEDSLPLLGIPYLLKDNLCTAGVRTTCASRMAQDFVPPYSATVHTRLAEAGGILLGKANMDEFAMGSGNTHSAFFPCVNPRNPAHVAGGSSGGSACALALGIVPMTLGTDTGGSARLPAAFCGTVAMRPTYGAISRYGMVSFASSMDQICPMTRTVADNRLLYGILAGLDPRDATTRTDRSVPSPKKGKIALYQGEGTVSLHPAVEAGLAHAAQVFRSLGYTVEEVTVPSAAYALPAYHAIADAEVSSNLSRFDGIRFGHRTASRADIGTVYGASRSEGFGDEVKRRILLGTWILHRESEMGFYRRAQALRQRLGAELTALTARYDCILSPVHPALPPLVAEADRGLLSMYENDIFTVPAGLTGLPALAVPSGYEAQGFSVGIQLMGRPMGEEDLYAVAQAYREVQAHA